MNRLNDGASTSIAAIAAAPTAVGSSMPSHAPPTTTAESPFLHPSVLGRPPSAMLNGIGNGNVAGGKLTVKLSGKSMAGNAAEVKPEAVKKAEGGNGEVGQDGGKGKGKAKASVDWTPQQVEQLDMHELGRHWGPHLVSLQVVIQRTVAQVFGELQLVAETAPSLSDFERKKRLIDYVIHSRRQIIKLLVLVKWSASSAMAHKVISIVEFLARQNKQFRDTVDLLHQSKNSFYTARLRNYDIPHALRVLTHGRPPLPKMLTDAFGHRPDLSPSEVLAALDKIEAAMRLRLGMREVLPEEMRRYTIGDGKANFRVEGLFEATMTLSGAAEDEKAIWYLLKVGFLFNVTSPRGTEYSATPTGAMRERILMLGNQELAGPPPSEQQPNPAPPARPLVKIFVFLRLLALNYQLEALFTQASQLDRTAWAGNVRATIPHDRKSLQIEYWTRARPPPRGPRRPAQAQSSAQGTITISIASPPATSTTSRILSILGSNAASDPSLRSQRLQISWQPTPDVGPPSAEALARLQFQAGSLDLESLLTKIANLHMDVLIRRALSQLQAPLGAVPAFQHAELAFPNEERESKAEARGVRVRLQDSQTVEVGVDRSSGRYTLRVLGSEAVSTKGIMKRATETLNEHPEALREMLVRVRSNILLDNVEAQAAQLGLRCTRRLPIDPAIILGTGPNSAGRAVTYFSLPGALMHYLAVLITEDGVRCSLLALRNAPPTSRNGLFQIAQNVRVVMPPAMSCSGAAKGNPFSLTRDELRDVFYVCSARIAFNSIARQLVARRIPVKFVPSFPPPSHDPQDTGGSGPNPHAIPFLCIPSKAVLRTKRADVLYPIIRIRLRRGEIHEGPQVLLDLRLTDASSFDDRNLPPLSEGSFDPSTGVLLWTNPIVPEYVDHMLEWLEDVHERLVLVKPPCLHDTSMEVG